ncbi:MAG: hypothetical protein QM692_05175 [Thermomicrobiales bacterium]
MGGETPRRRLLGVLAASPLAALLPADMFAKKGNKKHGKGKGKKRIFCLNGVDITTKKKRKKQRLRKQGAVRGRCSGNCTPVCPVGACGGTDGCGGVCGCGSGSTCLNGTCQTCSVTCTGTPAECGSALQAALTSASAGDTVLVCPGRYQSPAGTGFTVLNGITLQGAGRGDNPAIDTILDAANQTNTTVIISVAAAPVTFSGLRVTGGNGPGAGGIVMTAQLHTIQSCAIVNNTGQGAGALATTGPLLVMDSLISGNTGGVGASGAITFTFISSIASTNSMIENTEITGNAGDAFGGILMNTGVSSTHTLTVSNGSKITGNTMTATVGDRAGGIGWNGVGASSITVTDTTISGNTSPQCLNATGCSV